ncbi:MAG: DUF1295 domain-containing protein [Haloechinothrix sp.]
MNVTSALLITAVAAIAALTTVVASFVIACARGRYDTIDSAWGAGFAIIAVVTFLLVTSGACDLRGAGATAWVLTLLTVLWGLRLSVHIHRRNTGKPEDLRYQEILDRAGSRPALRMFGRVYLTQGLIMWFVSLPVQAGQFVLADDDSGGLGMLGVAGVAVWLIGFAFEAIGDEQLRRFKADPSSSGTVLRTGLWRYTRHPNYFGDACVWWGLYLLAAHHPLGAATILSPILMTWLLAKGTGKPLLERHMDKRPGYRDYIERTSGFFPLPPKKA